MSYSSVITPPLSSLAPIKSRTETFRYWLTQIHPEKWPLKWRIMSEHIQHICIYVRSLVYTGQVMVHESDLQQSTI